MWRRKRTRIGLLPFVLIVTGLLTGTGGCGGPLQSGGGSIEPDVVAGGAGVGSVAPRSVDPTPRSVDPTLFFFTDVTEQCGIRFSRVVTETSRYFMPDVMGSGCALFDFDSDGDLDIYLIQSGPNPASDPYHSGVAESRNRLYRQDVGGIFTDATDESGLGDTGYGMGVAVGDVDNDGHPDLYLTNFGPDRLYRNNRNGTFSEISQSAGIGSPGWGTSASFFDYNRDGWLDLFVVNYVDYNPSQKCTNLDNSGPEYCSPVHYSGGVDRLFRNNGVLDDGAVTFTDVTVEAGIATAAGAGLGIVSADFTGDGYPDVYVANDLGPNFLWINQRDGTFSDEGIERGCAVNGLGEPEASMGIAVGDSEGDGDLDLFVTDLRYEANTLYLNQGRGYFEDATARSGLGPDSVPFTAFGTVWMDLENDGDLDLPIANGRVFRDRVLAGADLGAFWNDYAEPNQLYLNDGKGSYREMTAAAGDFAALPNVARGLATGDLDHDGDLDIVLTAAAGSARVYRNDAPDKGHWLLVRAVDPRLRRDAIGAEVYLDSVSGSQLRVVQSCSSYLSSHDVRCHFGLGTSAEYARITVQWPDGLREEFPGGAADRVMVLSRGSGATIPSVLPGSGG